jgi:hypothetical protein
MLTCKNYDLDHETLITSYKANKKIYCNLILNQPNVEE